jgi:hypothetical protein
MNCKVILKPSIARTLLHKGNIIIDIKPNKNKINETVFVFENTEKLNSDLITITK